MQGYSETYEKWRNMLSKTNMYFVAFVFTLEVIMFFVLKKLDLIDQPIRIYLMMFFIIPTIANITILLVGDSLSKHLTQDNPLMNYIPVVQMSCICFVATFTHFIFSITFGTFCFPIIATVIFGDKKMTKNISVLCTVFITIALINRKFSPYRMKVDNHFIAEAIIAFAMIIACRIICEVLIQYLREKSNIIYQGYLQQIELKEQLAKDQKTGLHSHTALMNTLYNMIDQPENSNQEIALAIIDIDDFKRVNDTYGHLKGDQVIYLLSNLMKREDSENRFMARFGGEEFAIVFMEKEKEAVYGFLEKLRIEFQKQSSHFCEETITISVGVAAWEPGWDSEELFEKADKAMYTAKTKGKNRTIIYE